jgi:hypothetical protein
MQTASESSVASVFISSPQVAILQEVYEIEAISFTESLRNQFKLDSLAAVRVLKLAP